jgi:hypothetical protein
LAARFRAEGHIAAEIALQIEDVKSRNALAVPDAAFALIRIELKRLAFFEVQVGIDAGDFVGYGGRSGKA